MCTDCALGHLGNVDPVYEMVCLVNTLFQVNLKSQSFTSNSLPSLCCAEPAHGSGDTLNSPTFGLLRGGRVRPGSGSASSPGFSSALCGFPQLPGAEASWLLPEGKGQGGFCGTAVTPSGDTREIPGSRELLPRPALGDQLTGLQMPRSIKKGHQLSLRAPVGAQKHIFKGSPHV